MVFRSELKERVSAVQTCEASWLLSTRGFHRGLVSQTISALGKVSRKPATAGNVCTMSPRAPRRTARKRGSGMRSLADRFEQISRGVIFWVANDGYANPEARGGGAFGNGFGGVVGSFGVNVRPEILEERLDARFAEEDDVIHGAKSGDEPRAGVFIKNGAARTFQDAHARIGIDADYEDVAFAACAFQIADVAHVKRVKASVGENDALVALFVFGQFYPKGLARHDLGLGVAHDSGSGSAGLLANGAEKFIARDRGCAALHDDEAARDVGDVRGFEG